MQESRSIDAADLLVALDAALPGVAPLGPPTRVPKGFSSESWRILTDRGELLIKVRRQQTDAAKLRSMHEAVRLATDAGVPTPEILSAGLSSSLGGRPLVVARYLPGDDAESALADLTADQREQFFADFGAAVGRLHLIPLPQFTERIGTTDGATGDWAVAVARTAGRYAAWNDALGTLDSMEATAIHDRLVRDGGAVAPVVGPRLTHRDLYPANLLLDAGRFAAILDFELAKGKDPLIDFTKLGMLVFEPHPDSLAPFLAAYRRVIGPVPLARERLILCHGLEHLQGVPNWRQTGEARLEDYACRQLRDWLAGHHPAWLVRCAEALAA